MISKIITGDTVNDLSIALQAGGTVGEALLGTEIMALGDMTISDIAATDEDLHVDYAREIYYAVAQWIAEFITSKVPRLADLHCYSDGYTAIEIAYAYAGIKQLERRVA